MPRLDVSGRTDLAGETVLVIDDSPTILKVVQLVLTKAGFRVETAPDGEAGLAAAREHRPDCILLDFVMPRMNGYQVCRALSADEQLRHVPVVLMSAKGDQVGERFVKVMGIVDYITKPFSPEAITAVVQHTIDKFGRRTGEADDRPEPLLRGDRSPEDDDLDIAQRREALATIRDAIAETVGARIAALFSLADAARDDDDARDSYVPTDADAIEDAARSALDDETLRDLLAPARALFDASADEWVLSGNLQVVPIAEVLQLLDAQRQSGVLYVSRAGETVEIYFRNGAVDLAIAEGVPEEFLLGRFILEADLMKREDFEGFLEARAPGSKLIGSQLVQLGYLSADDLTVALRKQTTELIYEVLRWNHGTFRFRATRDMPAQAVEAALGLDVEGILMEGFRRVDEWHLIEREIDDFDTVFLRNEDAVAQMGRGRLTREELAVLELVNGKNTVKEIIRASRMGSFEVSKMLYRLLSIKLIRRRVMPVAV
ncbi:MAG: response regulator [Deltaproteobacteria bacterium]|nr:MAG: response regulator [Deltaproteobacteria bacterium]